MSADAAPSALARAGVYALAVLLGAVYGAVASLGHRQELRIGDVVIPWGLVAALLGVLALLVGIRLVAGGRWVAAATAAGIIGMVALLTLQGVGGTVLVPGDVVGTIWSIGPALIAVLVVAWPELPAQRTAPAVGA